MKFLRTVALIPLLVVIAVGFISPSSWASSAPPCSASPAANQLVRPIRLMIKRLHLIANVQGIGIVQGVMQSPSNPDVVGWYRETAPLGGPGNTIMAGYHGSDVSPAVFYALGTLGAGDRIEIVGNDGRLYVYSVTEVNVYNKSNAPLSKIVEMTRAPSLTLLTDAPPFDPLTGQSTRVTVVRATLVSVSCSIAPPAGTPTRN